MTALQTPPPIPCGAKAWIVEHMPWLVLVVLALRLPPLIAVFVLNLSHLAQTGWHQLADARALLTAVQLGLMLSALPGLFRRARSGWDLLAAALAATGVLELWRLIEAAQQAPAAFSLVTGEIVPVVLLMAAVYVLMQVRPRYGRS